MEDEVRDNVLSEATRGGTRVGNVALGNVLAAVQRVALRTVSVKTGAKSGIDKVVTTLREFPNADARNSRQPRLVKTGRTA